jgi:CspA family cold shock protein
MWMSDFDASCRRWACGDPHGAAGLVNTRGDPHLSLIEFPWNDSAWRVWRAGLTISNINSNLLSRRRRGENTYLQEHVLEGMIPMSIGTVKWFNSQKGFGFVQPEDGDKDVFVHISAVERAGMSTLNEGQKISYDVVADQRSGKSSAENLRAV